MSEDQGGTKGQSSSDATVKPDAAVPAKPAELSDKDLEKVAGGTIAGGKFNDASVTNLALGGVRAPNTFFKPNK